jgi:hypothetical protein
MLASRIDSPLAVIVSPPCTEVIWHLMRSVSTVSPQCMAPAAGAKLAPSAPPQKDRPKLKINRKARRIQTAEPGDAGEQSQAIGI